LFSDASREGELLRTPKVEFGALDEDVDDRRTPSSGAGTSKKIRAAERDWPTGALGRIVAHLEAAIVGKARQEGRLAFFHRGFLLAPQIRAKPGMPAWARRRRPHHYAAAASSTLAGSLFKTGASQRATSAMLMRRA
jgi:hypothetical protein